MAHRRVIDCSWDEDTKVASVTLSSKWGTFTGYAKPHDEDADVANRWSGWRIAEYKCRVKIMTVPWRSDNIQTAVPYGRKCRHGKAPIY